MTTLLVAIGGLAGVLARYDSLPGLEFPGDPDRYPTRDEVVAYLTGYARRFELTLELDSAVGSLRRDGARHVLGLDDRSVLADRS